MCEHKVLAVCKVILPDSMEIKRAFCVHCGNTKTEIDFEQQLAALLEQQAAEIERLQIREHRMIEYMRDIKNFAFTINEVANNAIEEAEVQG